MTKSEMTKKIADDCNVTGDTAGRMINSLVATIVDGLRRGEKMRIQGLGTFEVTTRKARKGRNMATGEPLTIPARRVVTFRAADSLVLDAPK